MHHRSPGTSRRAVLAAGAGAAAAATVSTSASAAVGPLGEAGAVRPAARRPTRAQLRKLLSRMSLEEKVGQLFVMRVYGHRATDPDPADVDANLKELGVRDAAELISTYHVGGIIYFTWARNTRDPHQIAELSNGIQRASLGRRNGLPVLVSTDQEHGIVCRVGAPATLLPGAMALGAGGSRTDTRRAAHIAGAELAALGILQNYAPDADVNVNPANPVIGVRSFSSDPQVVADLVAAQVKGYQGAGVASCAKHFPGHGDTTTDSHEALPTIHHTREEWERLDAPPFRAAIAAGIDSIMTAHIVVPSLDPAEDPATLSRPILTGILREELGYDGVVVTDSLGMQGVRTKYGDDRVPVLALLAGVDQLLNPPSIKVAYDAVLAAVRDGELTEERIDTSVLRILELKARRGLFEDPYVTRREVDRTVGIRPHLVEADRIAERTTTLLAHRDGLLPLSRRTHRDLLVVGADPASPSGTTGPPTTTLTEELTALGFRVTTLSTGTAPTQAVIDAAVAAAGGKDAVVVGTYNVAAGSAQQKLVRALAATGVPVVALAIRNPYDVAHLPEADAVLAAYSWTDVELRAAVRVLAGRARPRGKLPVPVQRADDPSKELLPVGFGLRY
ncbi:glycoside hydrolase family 3 protein [Streptomyces albidoflavus]|uniref:glycoside hydrolase family 3 protein n=1 Tax=Streptomyces sp. PVA_94-07 TaxID=1225337 RepID=UPI0003C2CCBA|nr:glycoside hydrolase family 3 protein [Streptomyces sp. PVA_94-07]ESQ03601.1 Beta-N-acetylglucosaminidase [Streptomyces sp. PVA_94-07]QPA01296.1 beta-N-acetylhexosaminidase [Streptomyces violascens]QXF28501.1 beta-N-acetylglucosaminidase [Streptomyces violascens]